MTPRGAPPRWVAWTRACGRSGRRRPDPTSSEPPRRTRRGGPAPHSRTHSCTAATQELPHDVFPDRLRMASSSQIVSLRGRSYAHGSSDVPLLGENLRRTVERFGECDALVVPHQGYRASYDELWEKVETAARAFIAHGVDKGDRVAIWAPNR